MAWAQESIANRQLAVIVCKREFEAWFIGSAASLIDQHRLHAGSSVPAEPEAIADAKGWLGSAMGRRYSETLDQPAFAALIDFAATQRSCPSFVKLQRDMARILEAI